MDVAFTNHDSREHTVLVESIADGEVLEQTEFHADPKQTYLVSVPDNTEEVFAISDNDADVVETVSTQAFGTIPATTAVSTFSIINGIGGAASQLLASKTLANRQEVKTSDAMAAGLVAIAGAIGGLYFLRE